jgi:hypothetical protein
MIYPVSSPSAVYPIAAVSSIGQPVNAVAKINGVTPIGEKSGLTTGKVLPSECQTCKNRRYVDGSNEANVSFQTPSHISPQSSFAVVSSHEQEHVSNAVKEGSKPGNQLLSTSVALKTAVCPECGTSYISGGTTRTTIKYNEANPYESARRTIEGSYLKGMNIDYVA